VADKPVPDTATRSANATATPLIRGRLLRKPNWAPEAVAKDVAPPGEAVDTKAYIANATNGSVISIISVRNSDKEKMLFYL
jgi:hypothetical protein